MVGDKCVGTIICKLAVHKSKAYRGYIAMLAVDKTFRKRRIGTCAMCRAAVFGPLAGRLGCHEVQQVWLLVLTRRF
jgi:ribosomal protein S18 acetylase RimI-like enzyme